VSEKELSDVDPTARLPGVPFSPETGPVSYPLPPGDDEYLEDDDEEWVTQARKGLRVPAITGLLVLLLFAVIGFWGGAILQKHHDNKTATSRAAAALASALTSRRGAAGATGGTGATGGAGGAGAFGGGGAGRTIGTVTDVEGSTVYVTNAAGSIVKVNLAPTTNITKTTPGTPADIALGSTVIVTGTAASDGSTTASAITLTPAATGTTGGGAAGGTGSTGGG